MQNERKRILTMLENGTISMDEALTLLEAMEKTHTPTEEGTFTEGRHGRTAARRKRLLR